MNIIHKNEGAKIPYEVFGNKICFDDDLTINLAKREEDWPVHIDVCHDADGELVMPQPMELIRETRLFLSEIDCPGAVFRSNHASNYLVLKGNLNEDREAMIAQCDAALRGEAHLRKYVELGR